MTYLLICFFVCIILSSTFMVMRYRTLANAHLIYATRRKLEDFCWMLTYLAAAWLILKGITDLEANFALWFFCFLMGMLVTAAYRYILNRICKKIYGNIPAQDITRIETSRNLRILAHALGGIISAVAVGFCLYALGDHWSEASAKDIAIFGLLTLMFVASTLFNLRDIRKDLK